MSSRKKYMRRKQNSARAGCPGEDRVEPEDILGALSVDSLKGGGADSDENDLMGQILSGLNIATAARKVIKNKGAPGVDEMTVDQLLPYLKTHKEEILGRLRNDSYCPNPVRRVEIPKPDGGKRPLGIPTVLDRTIQQAMAQVLVPMFEKRFSETSYGFRPGRSAQQAMTKALEYYNEGYTHAVDIDIAKYFDTVNHDKLIRMVREEVKDERVISLIRKYLKSGVLVSGLVSPTEDGVPQGGPISPLLSNIYLTKLDKMLEDRGHRFVRYADDCNIYVKSRRAAERVMANVTGWLEAALKLKVNQDKSKVGSPLRLKFLGFSIWKIKGKSGIRVHEKSIKRFKGRVIQITRRNRGRSVRDIIRELTKYVVGWLGYFRLASLTSKVKKWDGWIRRRLRCYIWKQWKRVRARFKALKQLGVKEEQAWMWANTRKGYWRTAGSQIMTTTVTNDKLKKAGYRDMESIYNKYKK
jgi:group II intron reverse transcriptase/maturase